MTHSMSLSGARACAVIVLCAAFVWSADTAGARLLLSQGLGVSVNPLGVILDTRIHHAKPLVVRPGILWEKSRIDIGVQNEWTPTDDFFGARIDFEPVAFFSMTARAGVFFFFDALGYGYKEMSSPDDAYHTAALDAKQGSNEFGWRLSLAPTLKFKVSKLVVANTLAVNRIQFDGAGYYLEMRSYTIHRAQDTDFINDAYALWNMNESVLAGLNYHFIYIDGTEQRSHRLCAMGIVSLPAKRAEVVRVVCLAGAYVNDPLFKRKPYVGVLVNSDFGVKVNPKEK